jgi:hypothetical protein
MKGEHVESRRRDANLRDKPTQNHTGIPAAAIATSGEILPNGRLIELVSAPTGGAQLFLWDGAKETIGSSLEYDGCRYETAFLARDLLRELTLPTGSRPYGSTRELLTEVCETLTNFVGLSEKLASQIGRVVCCTWILEATPVAPVLMISGPDAERTNRLIALLRGFCRHALSITHVTPSSLCSLPSGLGFTLLISQPTISDGLVALLGDIRRRDARVPFRGRLLNLHGVQVIHRDSSFSGSPHFADPLQVPMIPGGKELVTFDEETQRRIASEFQSKFLRFRCAHLNTARRVSFDLSKFDPAMQQLARAMTAATPDDSELQSEVFALLREEDDEARERRWTDFTSITVEAISVACQKSPGEFAYIGEIAEIAQEIARRRGGDANAQIDAGALGKWLRRAGFRVEPRDQRGMKLHLTGAVFERAQQLARDLGAPALESTSSPPQSRPPTKEADV